MREDAALTEMVRIIKEEEPSKPSTCLSTDEALPSLAALRHTEPKKLTAMLRGELDWVVMKCLEKQRDRRYATANGLAREIEAYLADEPVEARPPSFGYRATKFLRRHKGPVVAAGLVLLVLLGGIVGTSYGLFRAEERSVSFALASIANVLITVGATVVLIVVLHKGALGLLVGNFVGTLCVYVALLAYRREQLGLQFDRELFRGMQRFGLPLVPSALALWAINFIDRLFIAGYNGQPEVGVYSAAVKIASVITFAMFATGWG